MTEHIKVLVRFDFPSQTIRLWDGSGPYMDADGNIWRGAGELPKNALDAIEYAYASEAATLTLSLSGIPTDIANVAYEEDAAGDVIGSIVQISLQYADKYDIDEGEPVVVFTGRIDNIIFEDRATDTEAVSTVAIEIVNRFNLRRLSSGSVYSDTDQRAYSASINPGAATADRFCERIPTLADKTVNWPDFG